jgi:hypothetical protein
MWSSSRHVQIVALALGVCATTLSSTMNVAAQEAATLTSFDEKVLQLERTWQPGAGDREYEYFVQAAQLAGELQAAPVEQSIGPARKLLTSLLAKASKSPGVRSADFDIGSADLAAIRRLANVLLVHGNAQPHDAERSVELLADVLGRVRTELIPKYVPKLVVQNVQPPAGVPGMAGMNPDAIQDRTARQKYLDAIKENQRNNLMNKRQPDLATFEAELASPIVRFMGMVVRSSAAGRATVERAIPLAHLKDSERVEVLKGVR